MELFLNDKLDKITYEVSEAANPIAIIILAHGAGAGMHHPFMVDIANRFAKHHVHALRFNFPYMEQGRKSPGSPKANIETWQHMIALTQKLYTDIPIILSGKSYGGRMASHLLADNVSDNVKGIVYLGFPLHAPGKESKDRANHLPAIAVPQLFLQGAKDKLANIVLMKEVVEDLKLGDIAVIEDADHSFNVPKRSGKSREEILDGLVEIAFDWMKPLL